ncbi:hypothetical protein RN001_000392 [Aquatica leii]|uniref:Tctex1 domain-containing protein 2 n=1 Tax=Aquatica leii TaxID=1421715 RepID=A0AAN7PM77_9COLE|nr:hypothetical protein RN001_000392 [Aquatica leii]
MADEASTDTSSAVEPPPPPPPAEEVPDNVSKKPSMMSKKESHVRMQVPEDKPVPRKSVDTEIKRKASVDRSSSVRRSTASSKEGILRRQSDRPSKSRIAVGSIIAFGKGSGVSGFGSMAKIPRYMNSYKIDSDNPFCIEKVEKILRDVLDEAINNLTYDVIKCVNQAKWASNAIRMRVKEEEYDRYRLIVLVTIGEKRYHDMCCIVRFLWDIERDKYAICVKNNYYVFAAAMCFGVYYE